MSLLLAVVALAAPVMAQPDIIAPPESLVTDGLPAVPAALAREIGGYARWRSALFNAWHPTRRELLISTRFGDTFQLHRLRAPGGARTQLTFFDDDVSRGISCDPAAGRSLIFSKDQGGDENFQIYHLDTASGAISLVTDGRSRNGNGVWARGGGRIAYTSTRRNGRDTDLYIVEPAKPATDRLLVQLEGAGWSPLDWSPGGRSILLEQTISANESALWIVDVGKSRLARLTAEGRGGRTAYIGGAFSLDGKRIVTTSDRDSEFRELVMIDLASRAMRRLTKHIGWDVLEFDLSPNGRLAAIVVNEAGVFTLRLIDVVSGAERPRPKIPAGSVTSVRWHRNGRDLGFNLDSASAPTDVYSLDVGSGAVKRWTHSETGGVDTSSFREPEMIHWTGFDGLPLTGFLYVPPARFAGKRPVLVSIHGGPEDQFAPYYLGRWQYLVNELGVALVFPNVRGSSGFGKTFLTLDDGLRREDALRDVGSLLDWIRSRPELDASRVVLTGVSYGGYLTLAAAARYSDRIRGAIDIVGPSNLVTFLENTAPYRRDLRRVEYGDERDPTMRAFLDRIAPLHGAAQITRPLFVVQGLNDPAVPVSESEQMVKAVRAGGTPVWYLLARDEGHGFRKRRNIDYQLYLTVLFLRQYLLDSPAEAGAAQ